MCGFPISSLEPYSKLSAFLPIWPGLAINQHLNHNVPKQIQMKRECESTYTTLKDITSRDYNVNLAICPTLTFTFISSEASCFSKHEKIIR